MTAAAKQEVQSRLIYVCVYVCLFSGCRGEWDNVSCWQSAAVGEVTTLPCPSPLLHLFGKHGKCLFFFFRCELGKCRSLTTNQRQREVRTEEDAEEVEGWGSRSKGENRHHWWWWWWQRWQNSHSLSLINHLSSNSWRIPVCHFCLCSSHLLVH